ncbi:hypothetical protein HYPSUDRAFT_45097 [Hypholoma sublateritium FD-334 SS-4]|uniref:Peptidase M24 domain-containing protein n=1 Tax=Hypholoma sublateritium (strain FD-334 SS-4) TaxID=945553 RepID=A0A0D2NP57_HYPSF|nr:hypothetical protein HYPSUDRAFT_45097 [Hypholoma sublateritium FD-334 SS-4]
MSTGAAEKSQSASQGLSQPNGIGSKLRRVLVLGSMLVGCGLLLLSPPYLTTAQNYEIHDDPLSPESYSHLASHCSSISPISHSEFASRHANLASALHSLGASAYIAEPGANTQFFGNFSKAQWSLSERPLLLIIAPVVHEGEIQSQVTILSPKFEATRAKLLPVPSYNGVVNYIEWAEDEDPYAIALSALTSTPSTASNLRQKLFVDSSIRKFIVDGLNQASSSTPEASFVDSDTLLTSSNPLPTAEGKPTYIFSAPPQITQMRERKSDTELQILKCVNEATLLAIREVHKKLVPGIHESYARNMMSAALGAAGLKDGGCLTLFGENAALPHGSGTDRTLAASDFALFDCTASLHGYYSDVTRTVALSAHAPLSATQTAIWARVRAAQGAALHAARNGTLARAVDAAARGALAADGLARYFTHRLGHGIGLEVHEEPYLRGGSARVLAVGHAFSDEPGVYIEGEVGVRIEDCFFVNAAGAGELLTAGVGGFSEEPWLP